MHTVAIVNQKGGVGKTTTAVNLGAALALAGQDVLVIDLDPQAAASAWLGFPNAPDLLSDVYIVGNPMESAIVETKVPRLYLAPASSAFARVEAHLYAAAGGEAVLRAALSPPSISRRFGYVLLDCPPNLGRVSASALMAASRILIPLAASALDVRAVPQIMDTAAKIKSYYNDRLEILGLLATKVDHTNNTAELVRWCRTNYPHHFLQSQINATVRLREAAMYAQPIQTYMPKSVGARDYAALADEVAERIARPVELVPA